MPIVWRIALSFAGLIVLTVLLTTAGNLTVEKALLQEGQRRELRQHAEQFRASVTAASQRALALSELIAAMPAVQPALAAGDRDYLLRAFAPVYQELRATAGIEQFHFHRLPHTSFLRLHDPGRFGDDLSAFRRMVSDAIAFQKPVAGLEVGIAGIGIRGVTPISHGGEAIGSVEFGIAFGEPFFRAFKERDGVDTAFFIAERGSFRFVAGTVARPDLIGEADLRAALSGREVQLSRSFDGETYGLLASPITDYSETPIGVLIVAQNMRHYADIMDGSDLMFVAVGLFALFLGLALAWSISRSIAAPIGRVTATMSQVAREDLSIAIPERDRRDEIGAMARAVHSFRDAMLASIELRAEHIANLSANERLSLLADNAFEGLLICVDGKVIDCNKRFEAMVGLPVDQVVGRPVVDLVAAEYRDLIIEHQAHAQCDPHELSLVRADGTHLAVEVLSRRSDDRRTERLYAFRDISEQKRADERIHYLAHHDTLTGLPNRTQFLGRLEAALALAQRSHEKIAVLFLDLDHFKDVNDILGHATGDRLLELVANRLVQCLRATDLVARLGGDEFAILTSLSDRATVSTIAERIIRTLSAPFDLNGQEAVIGCTIGISCNDANAVGAQEMLRNADIALYHGKGEGRSTYRFFEDRMNTELKKQKSLQHELRRALADDQFHLNYQPQVDLSSGRVVGLEALLRWTHPELGQISPTEFIPIAEETGLIFPIGSWTLREACRQARSWPGITVAVNLSPAQFLKPGLEDMVALTLDETELEPERLELEITERILLRDTESTLRILHNIRSLGVRISMDDFGTGYSSLSYLRRFPFDKIKLDRSFISDVESDGDAWTIVRAILGLGRSLSIATIAEGVETIGQLQFLIREGCDEGQGYYFGAPMPPEAIADVLSQRDLLRGLSPRYRPQVRQGMSGARR
jgi:diguanylate cyclase (GGDEF)-like protein/PAS domain S-box-containing protein